MSALGLQHASGHRWSWPALVLTLELQDIEAGIGIGQIHHALRVDEAVVRLDDLRSTWARIEHAFGVWRHVIADLARLEGIVDIVSSNAGIVIRRKDEARALEPAGAVLPEIVRTEIAALGAIIVVARDRQGGNAYRVGGHPHIEYPDVTQPLATVGEVGLVGQHEQIALGQRQRRMRAAAERWVQVAVAQ